MNDNSTIDIEPRYKYAKSEAKRTWKDLACKSIPVKLGDITKRMGITTEAVTTLPSMTDGVSQMDTIWNCNICYRKDVAQVRQRFTVAHELWHIILEHITFDGSTSQDNKAFQEKEANAFAWELLIPSDDLREFMQKWDKTAEDIIERYWVSKEVAYYAIDWNKLLNKIKI